jgi:hypothetical protein
MSKKKKKKALKAEKEKAGRRLRMLRWISWTAVAILALIAVAMSLFWSPGDVYYIITETYSFEAAEPTRVQLAVLLPTSGHYQEVLEPEIAWPGSWTSEMDGNLEIIWFEADLAAGEAAEAVIRYQVNLFQGEERWSGEPAAAGDLAPSDTIQSDHPTIIDRAELLTVNGDAQQTAYQIFDFTNHHLDLKGEDSMDADVSALDALQAGSGGSRAHANLMAALSRTADLPAHVVSGLLMPEMVPFIPIEAVWDHPAKAQSWVEILVGDEWQAADPSLSKYFFQRAHFGWMDGRHLVYETTLKLDEVYEIMDEAPGENDTLIGEMSAPLYFVAWTEAPGEAVSMTPTVTLYKTWDARYLMAFSIIIILAVINWLFDRDRKRNNDRHNH